MKPLARLTWLKVLQGFREKLFWSAGLFFLALLGLSWFLSALSVGERERVLRGAGLVAMEWSGLSLVLLSGAFGFYRDRASRMIEVFLVHVSRPVYTASHLGAALVLAFVYLVLAGLCWSAVLTLHHAFVWPLWIGLGGVFLKLALAISLNLLFCCLLSSPTLAVVSTLFMYVAGALAPAAFDALALQIHSPFLLGVFKGFCALLPNLRMLDLTTSLLAGQPSVPLSLALVSGYAALYCLLLWSASTWVFLKQDGT